MKLCFRRTNLSLHQIRRCSILISCSPRPNCREGLISPEAGKGRWQTVRIGFMAKEKELNGTEQRSRVLGTDALPCKYWHKLTKGDV